MQSLFFYLVSLLTTAEPSLMCQRLHVWRNRETTALVLVEIVHKVHLEALYHGSYHISATLLPCLASVPPLP